MSNRPSSPSPALPSIWNTTTSNQAIVPQMFSQIVSTSIMSLLVSFAYLNDVKEYFGWIQSTPEQEAAQIKAETTIQPKRRFSSEEGDDVLGISDPLSRDPRVLIEHHGYPCREYKTVTQDGFVLTFQRIQGRECLDQDLIRKPCSKETVLILHGLFQSSGVFISNGIKSSLAFYLADRGYDVWLANNRCATEKEHISSTPQDLPFWDWSLDELARYDFPQMVHFVCEQTGKDKISFIGHSQGNAQAFLALTLNPLLNQKLKCFVAIAPAVYIGPLLRQPPVSYLTQFTESMYGRLFGIKEFLPIMNPVQKSFSPYIFASLGYHMFHYLFGWHDTNWDKNAKPHYFQFTPRPTSSKIIYHWCIIGKRGVIGTFDHTRKQLQGQSSSELLEFQPKHIQCPLALFYGNRDEIIDGDKLVQVCRDPKNHVNLLHSECIETYEHLDPLWAIDAKTRIFSKIVSLLKRTV